MVLHYSNLVLFKFESKWKKLFDIDIGFLAEMKLKFIMKVTI